MTVSMQALASRTTSSFPVSIGTALALESIATGTQKPYDPDRIIPNKINIKEYDYFYINLMSLFRNILGSVSSKDVPALMPGDIVQILDQEVSIIKDIISMESNGKTKCLFYVSKYENLNKKHPYAFIRKDNTDKQKQYSTVMQIVINEFIKTQNKDSVEIFDLELESKTKVNALILTHFAYDLLSNKKFSKLDLIESHTGVLKDKSQFYTKLTGGKELIRIPFNDMSMQVFGDSQTFTPMPSKTRQLILDLADKYQWHQGTTRDRLFYSINTLYDKLLVDILRTML
jgi:hypothetical protein